MRNKAVKLLGAALAAVSLAGVGFPLPVQAVTENGWEEEGGSRYWYENGVRQGTEGRGREIYDPGSGAWYWLDSVDGGKMAVSKDVYQDSAAGPYADKEDGTGKWCRYDSEGRMVKGWNTNENGASYFDPVYGAMVKGQQFIDGVEYFFDENTGVMQFCSIGTDAHWEVMDGREYWYEGGVRQGYDVNNAAYRGKEIYDPVSDAWYWLDNVQQGAKTVNKDVYQESAAGEWAEKADGTGKWVRYDENGHMVKGWSEDGRYYFDPVYGTMAKGEVVIDGTPYSFDGVTGILERENADTEESEADELRWEITDRGELIVTGSMKGLPEWGWYNTSGIRQNFWSWLNAPWAGRKAEITSVYMDFTGAESLNRLFYNYKNLTKVDISKLDTGSVTDMSYMFYSCRSLLRVDLGGLDTGSVTNMYGMFSWCTRLKGLDLQGFDTAKVTDMGNMFLNCFHLAELNLNGFDTGNVENMNSMFKECHELTGLDLGSFDTGNVRTMRSMFYNCEKLKNLDLSGFRTACVTDMHSMFLGCAGLESLDLSAFCTTNVTNMNSMFYNCTGLEKTELKSFDTAGVTDMSEMFSRCERLERLDLRSFDTGSVKSVKNMFYGCTGLNEILVGEGWTIADTADIFTDCGVDHVSRLR